MTTSECVLLLCCAFASVYSRVLYNSHLQDSWSEDINDSVLDGDQIESDSDIKTIVMSGNPNPLTAIANFPQLTAVHADQYGLTQVPILANVPVLKRLSLAKNNIESIKNGSISTSPVEYLVFTSNRISEIYDGSFGQRVEDLFLTCNELTEFSPKWFSNPAVLILLHLGGNKIKTLRSGAFDKFAKLERLELRNNLLTSIEDYSLAGTKNLNWIHLGYNNLTGIPPGIFGDAKSAARVNYFDITYNWISFLPEELLDVFKVDILKIWGNPWQCFCRDKVVKWWHSNSQVSDPVNVDRTPCVNLEKFQGECVEELDQQVYDQFKLFFTPIKVNLC